MLSDQEIMIRCCQGQGGLLDLLIDRHGADLYTFCLHLCGKRADAEDLFQDSWLAVLRHSSRYDTHKPFRPWLFTICLNLRRDHFRRARRWIKALAESERTERHRANRNQSPEAAACENEKKMRLNEALGWLAENQRLPLLLYYYCGMPLAQVADVLNLATGTVKSRLDRARKQLRGYLQEENHG
jgi:RNA polymerase sigma-70 factor, ECF subfamily